jgi:hypothetical protein
MLLTRLLPKVNTLPKEPSERNSTPVCSEECAVFGGGACVTAGAHHTQPRWRNAHDQHTRRTGVGDGERDVEVGGRHLGAEPRDGAARA